MENPLRMQEPIFFNKALLSVQLDGGLNQRPGSAPPSRPHAEGLSSPLEANSTLMGLNPRFPQRGSGYFGLDEQPPWSQCASEAVSAAEMLKVDMPTLLASLKSSGGTMPNASSPLPNPPRPLNNLRTIPHSGRDTLGVSWTARAGSASQQLDALLQTFSPKHAAMLSSGGLSSGGLQSTNSVPLLPTTTSLGGSLPDHPTPAVTSVAAAAAVALQNSIFNVGSAPQSPSFRAHLQTFDATVGSPVQGVGKAQGIGSAGTSGASSGNGNQLLEGAPSPLDPPILSVNSARNVSEQGLGPHSPKPSDIAASAAAAAVAAAAASGAAALALRGARRTSGPSKLRISSTGTDGSSWNQAHSSTAAPATDAGAGAGVAAGQRLQAADEKLGGMASGHHVGMQQQQQRNAEHRLGGRQPSSGLPDSLGLGLGPAAAPASNSLMLGPGMPQGDDMSALLGGPGGMPGMQYLPPSPIYNPYHAYGQALHPNGPYTTGSAVHGNAMGGAYPAGYAPPGMMAFMHGFGAYAPVPAPGFGPMAPHDMHLHGMLPGLPGMQPMQAGWAGPISGMTHGPGGFGAFGPGAVNQPSPEWMAYYQMMEGRAAMAAAMAAPGGPAAGGDEARSGEGAWGTGSRVWPGGDGRWGAAAAEPGNGQGLHDWQGAAQRWANNSREGGIGGAGAVAGGPASANAAAAAAAASAPSAMRKPAPRAGAGRTSPPTSETRPALGSGPTAATGSAGQGLSLPSASRFELQGALGHICELCLDQQGSRLVQAQLDSASPEELERVTEELQPRLLTLATDVFANYVVQKLLECNPPAARARLAGTLRGSVVQLSLHMYGCRVVQRALELLPSDLQCEMLRELIDADGQALGAARDQNGNHVVQKLIECLPPASIVELLDLLVPRTVELSCHPYGCRVVQRLLERCHTEPSRERRRLALDSVVTSTTLLARDQYGNYVVQNILEHGSPDERGRVLQQLVPEVVQLSMHKFASNVVEKGLTCGNAAEREMLVAAMLGSGGKGSGGGSMDGTAAGSAEDGAGQQGALAASPEVAVAPDNDRDPLQMMMKDQYGNFVVQKALEVSCDIQRQLLLARVHAQLHALRKFTYGKHIVARVEKLLATAGNRMQAAGAVSH